MKSLFDLPGMRGPRLADMLTPETNSFGVLRFAMATLVLISHSYLFAYGSSKAEPLEPMLGWTLGECAVQVFFFLSGVMVAQSFDKSRNIVDFAAARALRIFPALIVCVLFTALLIGPVVSRLPELTYFADPMLYTYIAKTVSLATGSAGLPGVFEDNPYHGYVNSSLWTLKYEVLCYVGLGIAGAAGMFQPKWRAVSASVLALLVATAFLKSPVNAESFSSFDSMRYFAVIFGTGVLAYLLRDRLIISGWMLIPLFAVFLLTMRTDFAPPVSGIVLGYAALWAATKTWGPMRGFCNRFDTSFGIYIFAGPVQQSILWMVPAIAPLVLAPLAFAIVFPMALVSWVLLERPAMRMRRSLVAKLQPGRVAREATA